MKKIKGKHLDFISQIKRDGYGINPVSNPEAFKDEKFSLMSLSIKFNTFIATNKINHFVVKIIEK